MKLKLSRKGKLILTSFAVIAVVITMVGGSYAIFSSSVSSGEYNVVKSGNLEISYVEGDNGAGDMLSLNGVYPTANPSSLTDLMNMEYYRFSLTNTGDIPLDYRVRIEYDDAIISEDGCSSKLLGFNYIRYNFDKTLDGNNVPVNSLLSSTTNNVVYDSVAANQPALQPNSSKIHEIRLWIDSGAPNSVLGKHFHGKVVIDSVQSGVDMRLTQTYSVGDSVTLVDDSTWHVIKDASKNSATVTLLKDDNVDTRAFDTEDLRPAETNTYCINDEYGCNVYDNNGTTTITNSTIKDWLETSYLNTLKTSILNNSGTVDDLTVSLPSMEQLVEANKNSSKKFNQTEFTFDTGTSVDYLTSTSYWTKTAVKGNNTAYVWYVNGTTKKSAPAYANNTSIGVRPVIVTSKLNLK